jgi:hypothetical protein
MKVCAQRIPEDVDVVFIVGPEAKVDKFMSYGWLESRYYIAKAAYFLYPRRVVEKNFKPLNLLKYIIQYNYNAEKQEFCLNQR